MPETSPFVVLTFVKKYAQIEWGYGGGCKASIKIGSDTLEALDGKQGEEAAYENLAQKVDEYMAFRNPKRRR